ncbi:hypothetical protein NIES4073_31590 [Kalymmatonema gypsitolerans NIES-4073]|nr:hypothetical protein NIES4073_31590 [Scytonema sp. NIES-4073]
MSNQNYPYDIALSFAGEDRKYAQELAQVLKARDIDVFYDEYEEATLWGKNLYTHLSEVYQKQARFCVMFLSQYYAQKLWTNHEREAAQARAFQENKEYILPIRLDNTEIPGILPTIGYLKWSNADSIANTIVKKLEQKTPSQHQPDKVNRIGNSDLTKSSSFDQIVKEQKSLSGEQRKKLQDALIDAFLNKSSLEQMLDFELDKNLNVIAGEGSLQEIVFKLIRTAESQGWLLDLVRAARKSNPGNPRLLALD